jgi:hypothetical protein
MKRLCAVFTFCLIFCVAAFPQESGTIVCDPDSTVPVPAWTSPGGTGVVEQLLCGQMVSIIELDRGYFKIRIGDRIGYVYAKYVRLIPTQERRIPEPEAQVERPPQPPQVTSTPKSYPPAMPAEKPAEHSQIDRGLPRRHEGGLYFDASHMYYGEVGIMRNKGYFWGLSGDYTYRPDNFMLKVDGRFSIGSVDYWSNGTGTADGLRDYNFETRFAFGYDLGTSDKASFIPFIGLGYRYLFDGESGAITTSGHSDYDRKSNYLYSPVGMETMFRLGKGWSLGVTGEYDLLWHGWQYSELKDAELGFVPLKNDQNDGWGARGSVAIIKSFGKIDFAIEPYFRYWDIEESDVDFDIVAIDGLYNPYYLWLIGTPGVEPKNSTMEWGARVGIRF